MLNITSDICDNNELVKNSNTSLSLNLQNKMIK